jgi:hypothetical protein
MKTEFTKTHIRKNKGCYKLKEVNSLSFINNEKITIIDIIKSEIKLSDKLWFVKWNCNLTSLEKENLFSNIKNCLLPENKWMVWSVDDVGGWLTFSGLPGSEQKKIIRELIKFFK